MICGIVTQTDNGRKVDHPVPHLDTAALLTPLFVLPNRPPPPPTSRALLLSLPRSPSSELLHNLPPPHPSAPHHRGDGGVGGIWVLFLQLLCKERCQHRGSLGAFSSNGSWYPMEKKERERCPRTDRVSWLSVCRRASRLFCEGSCRQVTHGALRYC